MSPRTENISAAHTPRFVEATIINFETLGLCKVVTQLFSDHSLMKSHIVELFLIVFNQNYRIKTMKGRQFYKKLGFEFNELDHQLTP